MFLNMNVCLGYIITAGISLSFGDRLTSSILSRDSEHENMVEYCSAQLFSAKCLKNEVIMMNYAHYGRMRFGRCLQKESDQLRAAFSNDPLFLGCSVDVLDLLDEKCSGRNQCDLHIPDAELQKEQPCIPGLTLYLEADFECGTVIEEDRSCIISVSANPLHMMTSSTSKLNCGTVTQPWTLEAPAGQQIDFSLVEFSSKRKDTSFLSSCVSRGQITDKTARRNVSICRDEQQRTTTVYRSSSNVVQVRLELDNKGNHSGTFLMRFVAVGCVNLIPPEDAWLRRKDNEATVGCYTTRQTWILRCNADQWVGVIGNCTTDLVDSIVLRTTPVPDDNEVIVIVTIVVIGLAVCLVIFCCGVICFRRYSSQMQKYRRSNEETESHKIIHAVFENGGKNIDCTFVPVE